MQREEAIGRGSQDELSELIDALEQMVERLSERFLRAQDEVSEPRPSEPANLAG